MWTTPSQGDHLRASVPGSHCDHDHCWPSCQSWCWLAGLGAAKELCHEAASCLTHPSPPLLLPGPLGMSSSRLWLAALSSGCWEVMDGQWLLPVCYPAGPSVHSSPASTDPLPGLQPACWMCLNFKIWLSIWQILPNSPLFKPPNFFFFNLCNGKRNLLPAMAIVWELPIPVLRGSLLVLAVCHCCLTVGGTYRQLRNRSKGRTRGWVCLFLCRKTV